MTDHARPADGVIDFGVFPPYGSFLQGHMFKQPVRAETFSGAVNMTPASTLYSHDMTAFMSEMTMAGISQAVVRGWSTSGGRPGTLTAEPMLPVSVPPDEVRDLVSLYPDRFIGFVSMTEEATLAAPESILAEVDGAKICGVTLTPGGWASPTYADDREKLYPVYELCERASVPIILDFGGNSGPDISYSAPLILDHIAASFPDLRLIISHAGWPWVSEAIHVSFRRGNVFLSPDMYIFGFAGWRDYVDAANGYLQDRLIFSSSYPYLPLAESALRFKGLFNPEVVPKLLGGNARRALGWEL